MSLAGNIVSKLTKGSVIRKQIKIWYYSPFVAAYRENYNTQHVLIRLLEELRLYLDNNYFVGAVMTDLSKAFDCIPHDLLIAKLEAYGFDNYTIRYFYSYLKNGKQCVKINNTYSDLLNIISGVPQGFTVGPILFNIIFNDFFYVILTASAWMITHLSLSLCLSLSLSAVKLLGIEIDDKLNFNNYINTICRSAANQLNALIMLRRFLGIEERKALIQSFVLSNFNYCPLVWMLSSVKSLNEIENLQKRALRFMLSGYESSYDKLLRLSGSCAINVRLKRYLCVEIYKTLNDLNPSFIREIFVARKAKTAVRERYKINLETPRVNQASFDKKSLKILWNQDLELSPISH